MFFRKINMTILKNSYCSHSKKQHFKKFITVYSPVMSADGTILLWKALKT